LSRVIVQPRKKVTEKGMAAANNYWGERSVKNTAFANADDEDRALKTFTPLGSTVDYPTVRGASNQNKSERSYRDQP